MQATKSITSLFIIILCNISVKCSAWNFDRNDATWSNGVTLCPDHETKCYNHGSCIESQDDNGSYECDCLVPSLDENGNHIPMGKYCHHINSRSGHVCGKSLSSDEHDPHSHSSSHLYICLRGTCKNENAIDIPPLDNHPGCDCENGWSGLKCDKNDGDNEAVTMCGEDDDPESLECFNDSTCFQVSDKWFCDCHTANEMHEGAHFVGRHCNYNVGGFSPDFPTPPGMDKPHFDSCHDFNGNEDDSPLLGAIFSLCLNGGSCKDYIGGDDLQHKGCDCVGGYVGDHCEIPPVNEAVTEFCQTGCDTSENKCLYCNNGGQCNSYAYGELGKKNACVCPLGWTGSTCSTSMQICDDGEHICMNGGKCEKTNGKYMCTCDSSPTQEKELCEDMAAEIITEESSESDFESLKVLLGITFAAIFGIIVTACSFMYFNYRRKKSQLKDTHVVNSKDLVLDADGEEFSKVRDQNIMDEPDIDDAEII